ncbi:MAG: hypothetical protein GX605_00470, partial [Chloroflexi bacterium]|nr:hypothetical protein [Chloroflexota bacterium]
LSLAWALYPLDAPVPIPERQPIDPTILLRQETANRRLAQSLHDSQGQLLANAIAELDAALPLVEGPSAVCTGLLGLRQELQTGLRQLRWLAAELEPPLTLDTLGLGPTLQTYAQQFTQQTGLPVRVSGLERLPSALPSMVQLHVFRIVQEALRNAQRHAQATEAALTVREAVAGLELEISDNGQGFSERLPARGLGLIEMQDRAEAMGAALRVRSCPGRGARVTLGIPSSVLGAAEPPAAD